LTLAVVRGLRNSVLALDPTGLVVFSFVVRRLTGFRSGLWVRTDPATLLVVADVRWLRNSPLALDATRRLVFSFFAIAGDYTADNVNAPKQGHSLLDSLSPS
jgi:hypothetical protein